MVRTICISCLVALLLPIFAFAESEAGGSSLPDEEVFRYRWSLVGFGGLLASLFLPDEGEGVLKYRRNARGHVISDLLITSDDSKKGEYWRYGSEIDPRRGESRRAWSSYRWRGEEKSKEQTIEVPGVRDIVAGIRSLRLDPPDTPRRMEIWSDGKLYPVVVIPRNREKRPVGSREVSARRYTIRGVDVEGRNRWKGSMELWLADDATSTPVEIQLERSLAKLRLRLVDLN